MRPIVRLILVVATTAIAACADSTAPSPKPLKAAAPRLDTVIDSSMCRSGYNITQGRCNE